MLQRQQKKRMQKNCIVTYKKNRYQKKSLLIYLKGRVKVY